MVFRLYRRIRYALWQISYYSANRPRSAWSKAAATTVVFALPLAIVLAIFFNGLIFTVETGPTTAGQIIRQQDGTLVARIVSESGRYDASVQGRIVGDFTMHIPTHHHGWPVTTSFRRQQAQLDINLYDEANVRMAARLPESSPIRYAIEQALLRDRQTALRDAYRQPAPPAEHTLLGWVVSSLMLWTALAILMPVSIAVLRFQFLLMARNRALRAAKFRARGLCAECGYNLRGLEFNERCPECGSVLD